MSDTAQPPILPANCTFEDPVKVAVLAAAQAAGLVLSVDSEAAVVTNARLLAARFAEFSGIPLPDSLDPAPVLKL